MEKRVGELVDEPGEGVGDGLGFEVVGHGGEVGPGGVAAEEFDYSRAEHKTKEEEGEGEADEEGGKIEAGWVGAEAWFFEEDEEEACFEEKGVPLEGEEILAEVDKGEPAEPGEECAEGSKSTCDNENGGYDSEECDELEREIGGAEDPGKSG